MDQQSLLNSLKNAAFRVNKRYHDVGPSSEKAIDEQSLLVKVHSMQDAGDHDGALDLMSKASVEGQGSDGNRTFLLLAKSISFIAIDQADKAIESLLEAKTIIPNNFSDRENKDYLVSRNLSSVHVNMATCFIMKHDYISATKHALTARNEYSQWHGPHLALFSSLLRIIRSEECEKSFTVHDESSDKAAVQVNHKYLVESINIMAKEWPEWNSDKAILSNLIGDKNTAADTDLVGIIEIIEDLGYSLNANG